MDWRVERLEARNQEVAMIQKFIISRMRACEKYLRVIIKDHQFISFHCAKESTRIFKNSHGKKLFDGRRELEYDIITTWDSLPVAHRPVTFHFKPGDQGLLMEVSAPFFDDPLAPPGAPGQPFNGLWEYEVVEAFFLNSTTKGYLEVELCPHGQHLVLLLSSGDAFAKELDLNFRADIHGKEWNGTALLPWEYFPPGIDKMNLYAIHGSGDRRTYEALYPIPCEEIAAGQGPNFHRLEYFKPFDLKWVMGDDWEQPHSKLWP
ncbi:UPF0462 protein C4orf33 homolog [Monodelphis domestica]|uniref:UPF0462 protein C4orf33 homolog n=1 Tax=Monodelphis domestica TaxID=13616 RepID=A0A5F8GIN1_MONDO|nr:UPF0462 protein C4orf33 homolog [Monodelphis domestica]